MAASPSGLKSAVTGRATPKPNTNDVVARNNRKVQFDLENVEKEMEVMAPRIHFFDVFQEAQTGLPGRRGTAQPMQQNFGLLQTVTISGGGTKICEPCHM